MLFTSFLFQFDIILLSLHM